DDGIRYFHVTGVQTCALPILRALLSIPAFPNLMTTYPEALNFIQTKRFDTSITDQFLEHQRLLRPEIGLAIKASARWYQQAALRSEERRVGDGKWYVGSAGRE